MLRFGAALILMAWLSSLNAQNLNICGHLIDEETGKGITDANIYIRGTQTGCTSDKQGIFCLTSEKIPVEIIFSHIGYQSKKISVIKPEDDIRIYLKPVDSQLEEVEVTSDPGTVPFYKDDHYAVLDYEISNDLVYLLIYRYRLAKSELLCKYINGDTVARSGILSFIPTGLFLDCLNYIHVLSKDSAYQVFLDYDTLFFPYTSDIREFRSVMTDCVASSDSWLFFREESRDHLLVNFFRINRKTLEKQHLTMVNDLEKMEMMRNNPGDRYFLNMDTLPASFAEMIQWAWVNKILYKTNTSTMQKNGDTLVVFNTANGEIELLDLSGKHLSTSSIRFEQARKGDWTRTIYLDPATDKPYTSFLKNGQMTLYQIDFATGEIKKTFMADHLFPQKVKIYHNYLFYIYDVPGQGDNKHLFKKRMENLFPSLSIK